MDDYVRQCALPGCEVPIDDVPGRPARRYCTAAHRAAARQARRASMQPDQQVRLAETLPWLREPDPEPVLVRPSSGHVDPEPVRAVRVPAPRPASPARRGLASRLGDHLPRRRRAIAVIGAAGILAGGYAVTSSHSTEIAGPTQQTPQGESSDGWAARAQVTLTSVDRQLDTIAQTEAAWNAMPEHTTVGTPAPVAELMDRKALLERRKAALQSQLDSYRALARTKADLELSEQNLDSVEKALQDVPTTGAVSSPDEATALAALQEQRDLRIRQRDAKKLELAGIEGNVEKAARAPLPDDGQQTTAVSDKVLDVIHDGGRGGGAPTTPTPGPHRPEVLAGGREGEQDQERPATTTSAPPDPRGPRDESAERRAGPQPAAAPKGPVAGTVDGAPEGGKPDAQAGEQGKGPVGKVVDTVGGVLGGGKQDAKPAAASKPAASKPAASKPAASKPAASKPAASKPAASKPAADKPAADKSAADKSAADKPAADKPAEQPKGPVGKVVDTLDGAVGGLTGGGTGQSQKDSAQTKPPKARAESPQKESPQKPSAQKEVKPKEGTPKQSAPTETATAKPAGNDRAQAPQTSGNAQARSAPAAAQAPTGGDLAGSMPGAELARAIVNSVPGGEAAAPAVEAAMRQAAAQYVEQSAPTTTRKSSNSQSSGSQSSSRKTPTQMTTTVVDDSGSTRTQSSGSSSDDSGGTSSSGSSGTSGSDSSTDRSSSSGKSSSDGSSGKSSSDGSSSGSSSSSSDSSSASSDSSSSDSSSSDSSGSSGSSSSGSSSSGSSSDSSSGSSDSGGSTDQPSGPGWSN